jgi:hypothetical protein
MGFQQNSFVAFLFKSFRRCQVLSVIKENEIKITNENIDSLSVFYSEFSSLVCGRKFEQD